MQLPLTSLTAISPIDGRYAKKTESLRALVSEYGLIYHRVLIEIRWFQALAANPQIKELPPLDETSQEFLEAIIKQFTIDDAERIKMIEATTNHDVKAVEYFLKERFSQQPALVPLIEFIHFACTSEDINNLAYALMIQSARADCLKPLLDTLLEQLHGVAERYAEQPMLSHTHGQPASPSTVGKEFANFYIRFKQAYDCLMAVSIAGKCNGATGNFNAHVVAYPETDWLQLSEQFVKSLGLSYSKYTTQIEPHDYIAEFAHALVRLNTILIDLNRDLWGYIALNYFQQQKIDHEVGSSTMPHKVNPIDFENSEGNLILANSLLQCLANQLPTSRWQRDLVDSTLLRNIGVSMAYTSIAYQSHLKGLSKLTLNQPILDDALNQHWEVLAEPLQTVMRRYGMPESYEQLKKLTRGQATINQVQLHQFIEQLELPESVKKLLKNITPSNYHGIAEKLAKTIPPPR